MPNLTPVRVKANANYTCQKCGATELIQAHHETPGDDSTLIALCAMCHSKKHPDLPRELFFTKGKQPYWHNKSAASLGKEIGVHSRTVIRTAKRFGISRGELSTKDEILIKKNIFKVVWSNCKKEKEEKKKLREQFLIGGSCNWCEYSATRFKSYSGRCPLLMLLYSLHSPMRAPRLQ